MLGENPQLVPATMNVAEAQRDLQMRDQLRQRSVRLSQLMSRLDDTNFAAVRVSMSSARRGSGLGRSSEVLHEFPGVDGEIEVVLSDRIGRIHSDLTVGANVVGATELRANENLAFTGMYPLGQGFVVLPDQLGQVTGEDSAFGAVLKPFVTARDLTQQSRRARAIDFYPRSLEQSRSEFPSLFQWVLDRVKPERDQNPVAERRQNWWLFTRPIPRLRKAVSDLPRFIVIPRTAKWLSAQFVSPETIPDTSVVAIASGDELTLGIVSSRAHRTWAWAAGGRLGVGNDPRYQHQRTFNPFPFPAFESAESTKLQSHIRTLAEHLDAHRKRQQAAHADLTLTGIYNVLEKLKSGEALNAKDKLIHEHGLVSVLKQLHDELDLAVLDAYGWSDLAPPMQCVDGNAPHPNGASRDDAIRELDEALLERLVALNAERAAEEARGLIRWLRPDFQNPSAHIAPEQSEIDTGDDDSESPAATAPTTTARIPWPKDLTDQVRVIADTLAAAPAPLTAAELADRFTGRGRWRERLPRILDVLVALGNAKHTGTHYQPQSRHSGQT